LNLTTQDFKDGVGGIIPCVTSQLCVEMRFLVRNLKDSSYTFQASSSDNQQNFGMLSNQLLYPFSLRVHYKFAQKSFRYCYISRLVISSREACQITKKLTNQRALPIDRIT